jgi:hypothetical protein
MVADTMVAGTTADIGAVVANGVVAAVITATVFTGDKVTDQVVRML